MGIEKRIKTKPTPVLMSEMERGRLAEIIDTKNGFDCYIGMIIVRPLSENIFLCLDDFDSFDETSAKYYYVRYLDKPEAITLTND